MVLTRVHMMVIMTFSAVVGLGLLCFALGFLYKWFQVSRLEAARKREQSVGGAQV
jgi:hypothetical protein